MKSGHILVVDDDQSILEAIKIILENEGFEVSTLNSGENLKQAVTHLCPRLILLDYLLSGHDGADITKDLKNDRQTSAIPVVLLSAHPQAGKVAQDCGANNFLAKPFELTDLINIVNYYLDS